MNKLIEIITAYLDGKKISERRWDGTVGDFSAKWPCAKHEIAEELSDQLTSSGLIGPQIQDVIFAAYPDGYKGEFWLKGVQNAILQTKEKSKFSDGYHTFEELYEARMAYNVALFNEWGRDAEECDFISLPAKHDVHKSTRHHDGELCFGGGWFIVVANLPSGQISNHYEMKHWDLFRVPAVEKAKYEWDGHTSEDVINRLKSL